MTDTIAEWVDGIGTTYAQVQTSDEPELMRDGSRVWCSMYVDLDYIQCYLLCITTCDALQQLDTREYVGVIVNGPTVTASYKPPPPSLILDHVMQGKNTIAPTFHGAAEWFVNWLKEQV